MSYLVLSDISRVSAKGSMCSMKAEWVFCDKNVRVSAHFSLSVCSVILMRVCGVITESCLYDQERALFWQQGECFVTTEWVLFDVHNVSALW